MTDEEIVRCYIEGAVNASAFTPSRFDAFLAFSRLTADLARKEAAMSLAISLLGYLDTPEGPAEAKGAIVTLQAAIEPRKEDPDDRMMHVSHRSPDEIASLRRAIATLQAEVERLMKERDDARKCCEHSEAMAQDYAERLQSAEAELAELREAAIGVVDAWPSADGRISAAMKNLRALVKGGA